MPSYAPGIYKFTVRSAEEAVRLIRGQLGPTARVLSVRSVTPAGWRRLLGGNRLEVIAQVDPLVEPASPPPRPRLSAVSAEPAGPEMSGGGRGVAEAAPSPSRLRSAGGPEVPGLAGLLRRAGLTETALDRLQARSNWSELTALPLHRALAETSRLLREQVEARTARPPLSRAAFLGTAGVGRTTALCKWLAQETFRRARLGHVVSVEFDRPNPLGPLPVFCEALQVPLAHFPCSTRPAVPNGFAYLDLPPISVGRGPGANDRLRAFLDQEEITERVLVLNAAYDRTALRAAYAAGRELAATHLVFTHLDEVPQWGKLWDYLFDESLEPLFLATGPSLTGDCEEDVPGAIVRRTLPEESA